MNQARSATLIKGAALVVAVESLALVALGVFELANTDQRHPSVAVTTAVFFFLYAAGLAWSARAFARHRSWSRGPVVLAQLIQLGVAWSFYGGGTKWVAGVVAAPAVVVLAIAFSPSTTEALYGHRIGDDESRDESTG